MTAKSNDLRNLRRRMARRAANLLDPNWVPARDAHGESVTRPAPKFPIFYPGMSTAAYIALFQTLRLQERRVGLQRDNTPWPRLTFTHRLGVPAPMLDPLVPEVTEEVLP